MGGIITMSKVKSPMDSQVWQDQRVKGLNRTAVPPPWRRPKVFARPGAPAVTGVGAVLPGHGGGERRPPPDDGDAHKLFDEVEHVLILSGCLLSPRPRPTRSVPP